MLLVQLTLTTLCLSAADVPWAYPEATARVAIRLQAPAGDVPLARPVRLALGPAHRPAAGGGVAGYDLTAKTTVAAQLDGDAIWLDPSRPLAPGEERWYHLYLLPKAAQAPLVAQLTGQLTIETGRYRATLDPNLGGVVTSLLLKTGGRAVETLGDGIHWWVGRDPSITQESLGRVALQQVSAGPVFVSYRVSYPNLLAQGNTLTTEYRFFRDFIEVDHHYAAAQPCQLWHLKLPVSLAATGNVPGFYSNAQAQDQPLLTSGERNTWTPGAWHDVSYLGDEPYGIGVIGRNVATAGQLYFMDSAKPTEHEWIYAEPFGWQKPVEIKQDFVVKLTVVPHEAGPGHFRDTLAKRDSEVHAAMLGWQDKGAPPADTDGDGLPDLDELRGGTNPKAADTDLDGQPDGTDPQPLVGAPPVKTLPWPEFKVAPTDQPQTIAEVSKVGGVPTIVLDGQPYGPMSYTRCAGTYDQLAEMGRRNYRLHFEMVGPVGWPGEQETTFQQLDDKLAKFLKEVPNARVILRLYLCNPRHFATRYPDEVLRFNDGETGHFEKWYAMKDRPEEERGYPSFASNVWREGTCQALYNYVTHVRQSSYSKNVVGYFICGGGTEEWYYWGDYNHNQYCVDFSTPMLTAFRGYLRRRYDGDVSKLRTAWCDETVDFATALPPDPNQRKETVGAFWNPTYENRLRDYYQVHNKVMEDSVLLFSRAVKQACDNEQLVGMFHGYLQNHWLLEGGQATLRDVLESKDIDFWSGPPQYDRRGPGEHGCARFPLASLRANGKLWISESDIRTNFSEQSGHNPALYGRPPSLEESLACLEREYAHMLCEGGNGWWFQMGREWYHHEPILKLFDQMQRCGEAAMAFDRQTETDIATVVNLKSVMTGPPWPVTSSLLDAVKVQETCRIGAPVDHWLLTDILKPGARRYKLYLLLNCFSLSAPERQAIDQQLRRDGATLIWMYAPGLFQPEAADERSPEHVRELLGFGLKSELGSSLSPAMKLTADGAKLCAGFDPDRTFGEFERPQWKPDADGKVVAQPANATRLPERFSAEGGTVLARYVDGGGASMAMRQTASATDLWIGSVMAPADLLRTLAKRAGCHLYCDADEIIYADSSFLAIHTRADGERTFHLRRPADVIEILSGQPVAQHVTEFTDSVPAYRTRVYFLGDAAAWQRERRRADELMTAFQAANQAARKDH